jgi:hypothetical protein
VLEKLLYVKLNMRFCSFLAPEIYGERTFIFDTNPNILLLAESLASEAKCLMNIFKSIVPPSDIHDQFQLELRKVNINDDQCLTFKMSLRVDPILWFKYHTLNGSNAKNLLQLYDMGSSYVNKVKSEIEHYPRTKNENEIERILIPSFAPVWCHLEQRGIPCLKNEQGKCSDKHYRWCPDENRGKTGECDTKFSVDVHRKNFHHTLRIDEETKPAYQCRELIRKLNRTKTFCLFQVDPNFWIYAKNVEKPSCFPYFIASARSDATPIITLNPVKHCTNDEYAQTSDAWQAVLQTLVYIKDQLKLNTLPLSRIYMNFGNWITQKQNDSSRQECHAHINIVLTRQAIEKINDINQPKHEIFKKDRKLLFPSLVGSILSPKAHRFDDACKLFEYINNQMTPLLINQNRELHRRMSNMEEELKTVKKELEREKEENERLKRSIYGSIRSAQEPDEVVHGDDTDDVGMGINDKVFQPAGDLNSYNDLTD